MSKKPVKTATSKLTTKYQATIPEPVRKVLHLASGDVIAFDIEDDGIYLRKARPADLLFAKALEGTMSEWESAVDEESYRDL
jgi:antitoxin PrlF